MTELTEEKLQKIKDYYYKHHCYYCDQEDELDHNLCLKCSKSICEDCSYSCDECSSQDYCVKCIRKCTECDMNLCTNLHCNHVHSLQN